MQVKISVRFHRDEITYFEMNRLYPYRQADSASRLYANEFSFDKSSSIKQTIYQKLANSNGNTFSFIPRMLFLLPQYCCFQNWEFNNSPLPKRGERKHSHKNINIPVFQICSRNNKTSLLLYACEVIYLINKGVISPYVQEQGEVLLKFNILHLHYVTHY